jgi:hypothetical protein
VIVELDGLVRELATHLADKNMLKSRAKINS